MENTIKMANRYGLNLKSAAKLRGLLVVRDT